MFEILKIKLCFYLHIFRDLKPLAEKNKIIGIILEKSVIKEKMEQIKIQIILFLI